jgi:hypothetical protein
MQQPIHQELYQRAVAVFALKDFTEILIRNARSVLTASELFVLVEVKFLMLRMDTIGPVLQVNW